MKHMIQQYVKTNTRIRKLKIYKQFPKDVTIHVAISPDPTLCGHYSDFYSAYIFWQYVQLK